MPIDDRPTVYSTDPDIQICPRCKQSPCRCSKTVSLPPNQQTAAIQRETKGRGGKTVTVIRNLQLAPEDMKALSEKLRTLGYKTKFTGG
jgi:translation initiation factor 1